MEGFGVPQLVLRLTPCRLAEEFGGANKRLRSTNGELVVPQLDERQKGTTNGDAVDLDWGCTSRLSAFHNAGMGNASGTAAWEGLGKCRSNWETMTEEATSGNPWAPDSRTLRSISRAAFELDDYWRIVEILHRRFLKFEKKNWRVSYNSLIVLEHLLTQGPESVAEEFKSDKNVIGQMKSFQYIDDTGFNWGLTVRKKSERIVNLLEEVTLLKEERKQARRLSRGIEGFGSFPHRSTPAQSILREKSMPTTLKRYDSDLNNHEDQENKSSCSNNGVDVGTVAVKSSGHQGGTFKSLDGVEDKGYQDDLGNSQMLQKSEIDAKENKEPSKEEFHLWNMKGESKPLLDCGEEDSRIGIIRTEDDHPFNSTELHGTASLLSARDGILQGC